MSEEKVIGKQQLEAILPLARCHLGLIDSGNEDEEAEAAEQYQFAARSDLIADLFAERDQLLEALEAAIECGMVPISSAKDGGAVRHARQVVVADMIRAAIAKAKGLTE